MRKSSVKTTTNRVSLAPLSVKNSQFMESSVTNNVRLKRKIELTSPRHFLTANSTTNFPLISFKGHGFDTPSNNKENQGQQLLTPNLARSHSYTKDYAKSSSAVFQLSNLKWCKTAKLIEKIETSRRKKINEELVYVPNQPADSGVFAFLERKNFEKHVEKTYVMSKNTFMMMKVNCNKIELPVSFSTKPETADLYISVAFNDENCDSGQNFRANAFSVNTLTEVSVENMIVKIASFKDQRFTIRLNFSMKSELNRHQRAEGDKGDREPQPQAN